MRCLDFTVTRCGLAPFSWLSKWRCQNFKVFHRWNVLSAMWMVYLRSRNPRVLHSCFCGPRCRLLHAGIPSLITHLHEYYIIAIFLHPVSRIWFAKPRRGREGAISLFDGFRNRYTNVEKLQTFDVGILLLNFLILNGI